MNGEYSEPNRLPQDMPGMYEILARQISHELETPDVGHFAVYEKELRRVWPLAVQNRKRKIALFASEHGFYLSFYKRGLGAIFVKESPSISA